MKNTAPHGTGREIRNAQTPRGSLRLSTCFQDTNTPPVTAITSHTQKSGMADPCCSRTCVIATPALSVCSSDLSCDSHVCTPSTCLSSSGQVDNCQESCCEPPAAPPAAASPPATPQLPV
ncbi:hypothetical protein QTO34_014829 [Cnephaeus nilssonii]|uniref:Uncharacterized protein n=1 Tax=Cnephaeus nilssonii TaxID=3371016 RepID=A0AA40LUP1_CNENI|nr:hypothetical protein QTO34_014829 [Eptesicus nilssonii]